MRVRMLKTAAGPAAILHERHEYELPADQAQGLIDAGAAVLVGGRETAMVAPAPERAVVSKAKARPKAAK